jgi:hypothetical protein
MTASCEAVVRAAMGMPARQIKDELLWRCPWHPDKHPSFQVNTKKNCFFCGPCGISGNAWQLAARFANADPNDKPAVTGWMRQHGLLNEHSTTGRGGRPKQKRIAEFYYGDDLRHVRLEPGRNGRKKDFIWEHRTGKVWQYCHDCNHAIPLYANHLFRESDQLGIVFALEGEAKVDLAGELEYAAFSFKEMRPEHCRSWPVWT